MNGLSVFKLRRSTNIVAPGVVTKERNPGGVD